ncbi:hypothetical protein PQR65_39410 [Paraburkholderia nemoris]|uniref:hypothetical protein n=1 Tax=Paraburkholderia nemoris TaxID=2793076 RepID=UPI0038BB5996
MTAATLIALVSQLFFQPPLAWLLSRHTALSVEGVWLAFPITNVTFAICSGAWFAFQGGFHNNHQSFHALLRHGK